MVFIISSVVYLVGNTVYLIFGSGEEQEFNSVEEPDQLGEDEDEGHRSSAGEESPLLS